MTAQEARTFIAAALHSSNVFMLREFGMTEQFVSGGFDIGLAELEMDSLAAMEFCISIEVNTGVSILPDDLVNFVSLQHVALAIQEKTNA
jgi:Phosphopantetheine attachment site